MVAYCLKITNIDPLKYDLLFERFLNPERISLPDVDVDFDEDGRADVLRYCVQKYGQKRVAQIVTFGTMAPKMAIKDVARVQKLALSESDRLSKLVPDKVTPDKKHGETPFDFVYKESPELAAERESPNQLIRNTLKYAEKLEGSIRQTGVHACGVIIGQDDLEKFAPMAIAKDAELNVVEFEGKEVVIGIGRFGPYVRHDGKFVSLAKTDDPYTVGLDRAVELISQKREKDAKAKVPIRSFPEEPGLAVLNGRYGPYIAFDGKNYRIPKGYVPEELTLEQCREIMAKSKKK